MKKKSRIAFFGSSLVSSYWNGAATYYRGIIGALAKLGYATTFYEPDAYDRQNNRDIDDPDWAEVVVYPADENGVAGALKHAADADIVIKASGVGVFDGLLEERVLDLQTPERPVIFWDVDAPATLDRVLNSADDPFAGLIPKYDLVLTYGGGDPVVGAYKSLGAKKCVPIYNGLDTSTHFPDEPQPRFVSTLNLLVNRLPDRESRIDEFFFSVAKMLPNRSFLIGGSGWQGKPMSSNVGYLGHVPTQDHNSFNCSPLAVLNVSRESMARYGFSPATRVFEAAGAGACLITDYWEGVEQFFEPGKEILVAETGNDVCSILNSLTPQRARQIGRAALKRALKDHTYDARVTLVDQLFAELSNGGSSNGR